MKVLTLTLLMTAVAVSPCAAQGLSAPDDPAQPPVAATADSTASNTHAAAEPLHSTASESFRAERNFIRKGNVQFNDSNWHRALEQYDKALHVNAKSIIARYNKAVTLLNLASPDNAGTQNDPRTAARAMLYDLIEDARTHEPDIAHRAYYNLGNMSYNDGDYSSAIQLYESSLRIDPDDYNARYNLRLAQLRQKQQEQNQDQQQDRQEQEQQQQQQQQEQQQQQQQQQQEQQQTEMTQSSQQILQSMQNKENDTRRKVQQEEQQASPAHRRQPEKPW